MATEYIHELGDSLSTGALSDGPHVKVIAPEKYKEFGSETYKTISVEINSKYTKPSGGIPKSDLASAVQTSLVNNVTLGNGEAMAITFPYSLRTGRSTALVLVSGNNSKYSLIEIGWFKVANAAIETNRIYTHVLASRDSGRDSAPAIYVDSGTSESGCAIYLDLNNSKWSTQMSVLLNCENASSVAIGAVSHATASSATDISGNMVWNVDSRRVLGTSSSSSWSGDDTNIPTRGAVEEKISDAMSGELGGWLGVFTVAAANYKCAAKNFKKGDWMTVSEAGTLTYWPKNGRTSATLAVDANSDVYWTSDGYLQVKPSTAVQVYPVTSLSDWNTLTSTGLYQVASQATNVQNSPADGVTGISCLVSASGGKVLQMAQTNATIFYRAYVTGNWSAWRDVKSAENATNAVNYMTNGQPYGIDTRFRELQTAIGNTVNTWMLVNNSNNWVKYNAYTGTSYDSGTLQSSVLINEIVYAAGNTTELDLRIGIGSITDGEKFAMFPPFGYCGTNGSGGEIRRAWKRFVRYRITIYNTSDSTAALYAICGGRATNTRAGYWRRGAVVVDYSEYLTPNTDPRGWSVGWLNKVQFATLLAHKWGTWEVWWYRDGPEDDPNFSSYDYMFITTIKAPSII